MLCSYTDVKSKKAEVVVLRGGSAKKVKKVSLKVLDDDGNLVFSQNYSNPLPTSDLHPQGGTEGGYSFTIDLGDRMQTWSEFSTPLYHLTVNLDDDTAETVFGMRDISVSGRDILVNGIPAYMRGTVENCCFPLTGYAPTDEESWSHVFAKCKEYGINMMRFHSFCPPYAQCHPLLHRERQVCANNYTRSRDDIQFLHKADPARRDVYQRHPRRAEAQTAIIWR